jgi:branched-chain amino acid aminotransferase
MEVWTSSGGSCLNGITRQAIIELCRQRGLVVRERDFSLTQVYSAEEAFVTGTFAGVIPVRSVDGRVIGSGNPGPLVTQLRQWYAELVAESIK